MSGIKLSKWPGVLREPIMGAAGTEALA